MASFLERCLRSALLRDSKGPTAPQDFQKNLFRELECPVCLEIAVPPIILCKNGHFVCRICRKRVEKCVLCREDYTSGRNYALENIVSYIKVKCRHNRCREVLTIAKLPEHLENCDCRSVLCNETSKTSCKNKLIDFDQYVDHLTEVHGFSIFTPGKPFICGHSISKNTVQFMLGKALRYHFYSTRLQLPWEIERLSIRIRWPISLYIHDGVTFILNVEIEDSVMFMWVSAMLPKAEAKNYFADLHIGKKDRDGNIDSRNSRNIKWTVGISSVHSTLQEIMDSETADHVTFPAHYVMSFSSKKETEDYRFFYILYRT